MGDGVRRETRRLQPPCPLCSGTIFRWGRLTAGHDHVRLQLDGASFVDALLQIGGIMKVRVCDTCGNVQLFLEEKMED